MDSQKDSMDSHVQIATDIPGKPGISIDEHHK
jgi:hypothetical protein